MISLLLTLLLVGGVTYYYFRQTGIETSNGQVVAVSTTGVKLDLSTIAHAEQAYHSLHGEYGPLDELGSTGVVSEIPTGRDGFQYSVETTPDGFLAVASRTDESGRLVKITMDAEMNVTE